jgi:hypothetical protein
MTLKSSSMSRTMQALIADLLKQREAAIKAFRGPHRKKFYEMCNWAFVPVVLAPYFQPMSAQLYSNPFRTWGDLALTLRQNFVAEAGLGSGDDGQSISESRRG